ncbi:amidohydrolase [Paenibacillus sp. 1001270B_150601_E10]|uniref:amidohydrolase n=1 Tax=Paenibacillus sp. 1001270B_150601_E10 TaxID=2787079 RepID=UPI00189CB6B5|nr:amidohydrolase [Paenibacillus sp. 1001270B_150601_E10]
MTKRLIIRNGRFAQLRPDAAKSTLQGYMVVEDDRIAFIGEELPSEYETAEAEYLDGSRLFFMPGLVNTHGHAAMTLLRGYGDDMVLQQWLQEKMWPMEAKFTDQDVYAGTALAVLEMLKTGTTTFVDMYDHMNEVATVCEQSGIRASLMRGAIGLCSEEVQQQKLNEAVLFAKDWNHAADGRITTMLAPHAPYTCPPAFIEKFVQAAHDLDLMLHTHMSETAAEVEQNVTDYGLRPVTHLEKLGFFSRPSYVAHAVHLTDEEIEVLAKYNVGVSHNPASNLKLASGIARVTDLLKANVNVSIGTDGAASNNNLDMFDEMRLTALIHKGVSGDPTAVPAAEAMRIATVNGAKMIQLQDVGLLEAGMKADFIAINIDQPHLLPHTDLVSHMVYAATGRDVAHVFVDGKQVVKDGHCITMDEERVRYDASQAFEGLLKR